MKSKTFVEICVWELMSKRRGKHIAAFDYFDKSIIDNWFW